MTCSCGCYSPFLYWKYPRPSIFASERAYKDFDGRSMAQIQAANVDKQLAQYGRSGSMGWVSGTGPVQDPKKLAVLPSRKRSA